MDKYIFGFFVATSIVSRCSTLLVLSRPYRSNDGHCNQMKMYTDMKECYGPLISVTEMNLEGKGDEVTAKCRHVEAADECFRTRMLGCGHGGATVSEMLSNVFQFACGPGLSSLLAEEACWRQESLKADIVVCTGEMESGFKTAGYNAWCRLTRDYISCIGGMILATPQCTTRAFDYIEELLRRSYGPAARNMRCDLYAEL